MGEVPQENTNVIIIVHGTTQRMKLDTTLSGAAGRLKSGSVTRWSNRMTEIRFPRAENSRPRLQRGRLECRLWWHTDKRVVRGWGPVTEMKKGLHVAFSLAASNLLCQNTRVTERTKKTRTRRWAKKQKDTQHLQTARRLNCNWLGIFCSVLDRFHDSTADEGNTA